MRIDFFIPGEPPTVTAQEKGLTTRKVGGKWKPVSYEKPEIRHTKEWFKWQLSGHIPNPTPKGPVRLWTVWNWTPKGKHKPGTFRDTKPDCDNLIKLFKDCMTGVGWWEDDAQVCSEITEKFYGEHPGIYVQVERLDDGDER